METQAAARSYLDFAGLGALRARATKDQQAALDETARQFEAMFIQMMLKAMRDASPESGLVQSDAMDSYRDMMDKELAVQMSKRGSFGVAAMLKRQLAPTVERNSSAPATADPTKVQADKPALPATRALRLYQGGDQ